MNNIASFSNRHTGTTDVVVIGAGHSGLAASYLLAEQGVGHIVLERGEIANAWRERNWESLKLLTPNWQTRLPGCYYNGNDPHGYMNTTDLVRFIENYARDTKAPVQSNTNVTSVSRVNDTYRVVTDRGEWYSKAVVIASGACNIPVCPPVSGDVPEQITQLTPHDYRSPTRIAPGGVLVVGASATGMQFADELARAGHEVTIAVGEHVRMPRRYRGRDILDWMHRCGILDESYNEVVDLARGRRLPSAQLVGSDRHQMLDLNSLRDQGVTIAGRLMGINSGTAQFSGSLRNVCALADLKMERLLKAIDGFADGEDGVPMAEKFARTRIEENPKLTLTMDNGSISTVIWATGFRPDYSWLDLPVTDRKGNLVHDGGVLDLPGLYVLGLPLMRTRKSSFIFGIEGDARFVTNHLNNYLNTISRSHSSGIHQDHPARRGYRRSA